MATRKKPTPVSAAARQAVAAARQQDAGEVVTVVAIEPLRIDGIDVAPDESIDIDVDMAVDLVERGLVRAADVAPKEA